MYITQQYEILNNIINVILQNITQDCAMLLQNLKILQNITKQLRNITYITQYFQ